MKILYGHQIFSRQQHGGVSRYIYELANRIPNISDNTTEVFAPYHSSDQLNANAISGWHHHRVQKRRGSALALGIVNTALGRIHVQPRKDIDIVHETYYSFSSYPPSRAKVVITVHDMIHELYPECFPRWEFASFIKKRAIERAACIICVSENTKRDLLQILDIDPDVTSVVYHGHSLCMRQQEYPYSPDTHKPYLLYVGKRSGYKNFAGFLAAYAESSFLRENFLVACFGGGPPTASEYELIKALHLSNTHIVFTGGDDSALASWYSHAAIFVYPSLYEGFGLPLLEAMSLGCPIACSGVGSMPEIADQAAEFFDPTNANSISSAIENVVNCPERATQLIEWGYARCKNFSWDMCAVNTLEAYQKIF